jgi:hypothetical protein
LPKTKKERETLAHSLAPPCSRTWTQNNLFGKIEALLKENDALSVQLRTELDELEKLSGRSRTSIETSMRYCTARVTLWNEFSGELASQRALAEEVRHLNDFLKENENFPDDPVRIKCSFQLAIHSLTRADSPVNDKETSLADASSTSSRPEQKRTPSSRAR